MVKNLGSYAWRLFPALLVALVIAACSDALSPQLTAPDQAELARRPAGERGPKKDRTVVSSTTGKSWTLLSGRMPEDATVKDEQIIGYDGGLLQSAGHVLYVPKGAVAVPTKFKITATRSVVDATVAPENQQVYVEVQLKAYTVDAEGNQLLDVGAQGFLKPVYLGLSYGWVADSGIDPTKANVLWMKSPTEAQETRTFSVNHDGKWVVAELDHFSIYNLGCYDC